MGSPKPYMFLHLPGPNPAPGSWSEPPSVTVIVTLLAWCRLSVFFPGAWRAAESGFTGDYDEWWDIGCPGPPRALSLQNWQLRLQVSRFPKRSITEN